MKINELNEKELKIVEKEMLRDYAKNDITLEEYCECHVKRCNCCGEIFFVDYKDNKTIMCSNCYEMCKPYNFNLEPDQYDIYVDKKLMEAI